MSSRFSSVLGVQALPKDSSLWSLVKKFNQKVIPDGLETKHVTG